VGGRGRQEKNMSTTMMFSVADFCQQHGISRGTFYKLLGEGRGPKAVKIGRRTLISSEAAEAWRRRMEREAAISSREAA
jgi:excisionase family DNA binding protein